MNLDEAIKRAKEVASEQKRRSGLCTTSDNECDKFSSCIKCAEEHEQLAEWLIQLKEYQKLEKRLKDIFGGDDFPLSVFVESFDTVLKEGKKVPVYAKILTYEDADKWNEYKELEEQGRLIKLPCSVGDTVYRIKLNANACSKCKYFERGYDADFCRNKDVKDAEAEYGEVSIDPQYTEKLLCKKHFYEIEPYRFQDIDDILKKRKEFGETIFFTKKEAKEKIDIHLLVEMDKATRKYLGSAIDKWIKKEEKAKTKTLQEENN